jgi:hypothetical protein
MMMSKSQRTPDFVVIGAQKSASTFVQNALGAHPDIYTPDGETSYFESPDFETTQTPPWDTLFAGREETLIGIKRPQYLGKCEVPARICANLPEAKLIAVLRNPIDRLVAAYFHQVKYGTFPPVPFEEGISDILLGGPLSKDYPRSQELLEFGLYAKHLEGYREFLDRQALLILLHDDILTAPQQEIRKVYQFLGVANDFLPKNLSKRPQKVVYSIPRLKFLTLRNRFLYQYNKDKTRLWVRKMNCVEWISVALVSGIDRTIMRHIFPDNKPALDATLHAELTAFYYEDVSKLSSMVGRDLSHWLTEQPVDPI